jgi:hypothetical protein
MRLAERFFTAMERGYRRLLAAMLSVPLVVLTIAVLLSAASFLSAWSSGAPRAASTRSMSGTGRRASVDV